MSRVEKIEEQKPTTAYRKDEVVEELYDKKKKTHGRFSCLGLFVIVFVFVIGFFAWQVAATGLVTIPVVSSLAFSEPKPVRFVTAGVTVEQLSETYFKTTLIKRLQAGSGSLMDRSVVLELPESSLTATLQNQLKKFAVKEIDVTHAQIVVMPNQELELFLPIRLQDHLTALTVHIALVAEKGIFDLKLLDVKLGSFHAPSFLIASIVQPFVNRELTSLNEALTSYMHVDSLVSKERSLTVSGTFTVQVKK